MEASRDALNALEIDNENGPSHIGYSSPEKERPLSVEKFLSDDRPPAVVAGPEDLDEDVGVGDALTASVLGISDGRAVPHQRSARCAPKKPVVGKKVPNDDRASVSIDEPEDFDEDVAGDALSASVLGIHHIDAFDGRNPPFDSEEPIVKGTNLEAPKEGSVLLSAPKKPGCLDTQPPPPHIADKPDDSKEDIEALDALSASIGEDGAAALDTGDLNGKALVLDKCPPKVQSSDIDAIGQTLEMRHAQYLIRNECRSQKFSKEENEIQIHKNKHDDTSMYLHSDAEPSDCEESHDSNVLHCDRQPAVVASVADLRSGGELHSDDDLSPKCIQGLGEEDDFPSEEQKKLRAARVAVHKLQDNQFIDVQNQNAIEEDRVSPALHGEVELGNYSAVELNPENDANREPGSDFGKEREEAPHSENDHERTKESVDERQIVQSEHRGSATSRTGAWMPGAFASASNWVLASLNSWSSLEDESSGHECAVAEHKNVVLAGDQTSFLGDQSHNGGRQCAQIEADAPEEDGDCLAKSAVVDDAAELRHVGSILHQIGGYEHNFKTPLKRESDAPQQNSDYPECNVKLLERQDAGREKSEDLSQKHGDDGERLPAVVANPDDLADASSFDPKSVDQFDAEYVSSGHKESIPLSRVVECENASKDRFTLKKKFSAKNADAVLSVGDSSDEEKLRAVVSHGDELNFGVRHFIINSSSHPGRNAGLQQQLEPQPHNQEHDVVEAKRNDAPHGVEERPPAVVGSASELHFGGFASKKPMFANHGRRTEFAQLE